MTQDVAIVLTAAILVAPGSTAVEDASARRLQYLAALRYCARFAPVYFLENSGYDLLNDPEFSGIPGVQLRQIAAQEGEHRGKGYREFHALDLWHESEKPAPGRILKITGRYLLGNIATLLEECRLAPEDVMLFDQYKRDRFALTSVFSVSWTDYGKYIGGLYREADDASGSWIERIIYHTLRQHAAKSQSFRHEPDVGGISGSSGGRMQAGRLKFFLRQATRTINRLFDRKFLYLRGTALKPIKETLRQRSANW
jgi:hypothetical protein